MLERLTNALIANSDSRWRKRILRWALERREGLPVRSAYGPLLIARPDDVTNMFCITGSLKAGYDDVYAEVSALKPGSVFIDIGANAGLFSLVASGVVGQTGVVIAFEPALNLFADLVNNIVLNAAHNII